MKLPLNTLHDLRHCKGRNEFVFVVLKGFIEKPPPRELPVNLIVGVSFGLLLLVIAIALVLWQRRRIMYLLRGESKVFGFLI